MIAVAVDVGGTFTDVVATEVATGRGHAVKVPTTPGRLADGVIAGTLAALDLAGAATTDVARFVHGTTVGTNAVLERRGATLGLLSTEGFEDVLEIGRTRRGSLYDLAIDTQTPVFLAPRRRRRGVRERLGADGGVVVALDERQALTAIDDLLEKGMDALAVCLLHAYRNDVHERRVRELALERSPGLHVSISSQVDPVFREYERTVVTCFDAYLRPVVAGYLEELGARLVEQGIACPLQLMQSRGGVVSRRHAEVRPVSLLLSGLAAGVVGATRSAAASDIADAVALDVGGTSADVALIKDGRPFVTTEGGIDGFPLRLPLVDVLTIGAGGGSIAWLDAAGGLHVGPRSAGARPGPICYGRGGTQPTVTDAFLVLGLLDPAGLAAGSLALDLDAARAAFERLGAALGLDADTAADGVIQVATMRMVDQVRLASVGRGVDPRGLALVALGGAGPMFAGAVAAELGISKVVIPPVPGALSALGLFVAPVEHGVSETVAVRASAADPGELESTFRGLEGRVRALMDAEGAPESGTVSRRSVDARYVGQGSTVEVSIGSPIDERELRAVGVAFHERHRGVHGHAQPGNPVELLNARVVQSWRPEEAGFYAATPPPSTGRTRAVRFGGDVVDAAVIGRRAVTGERRGPLIVEQADTTILVAPGHSIAPDGSGNLILAVS